METMGHASPEAAIRGYLDRQEGPVEATVAHLLATFEVTEDGLAGRERISAALAAAGVRLDRDLALLGVDEEVNLTVVGAVARTERAPRRWRGPLATLVLGLALGVGAGSLALGVFIQMQSSEGSYVSGVLGSIAHLLGAGAPSGGSTPLWLIALFIAMVALCGLGFFMAAMGTIWLLARGTRYAATAPQTQRGLAFTARASRRGAHAAQELSQTGYAEARELASAGATWSQPRLARGAARVRSWRRKEVPVAPLLETGSDPTVGGALSPSPDGRASSPLDP